MQITITWQSIITAAAVIAALLAIYVHFAKIVRWIDRQKTQGEEITSLKNEMELQTRGILACLKGLAEQGCDGPVMTALKEIEEYINKKAHE